MVKMLQELFAILMISILCVEGVSWYIRPDNTSDADCLNNTPCQTLDSFVKNISGSSIKNLRVLFFPGNHVLSFYWNLSNMNELYLRVNSKTRNATITCNSSEAAINLENITKVFISFIMLQNCNGNHLVRHTRAALYIHNVVEISAIAVSIKYSRGYGLYISQSQAINLTKCNFSTNHGSHNYEGGNAKLVFTGNTTVYLNITGTYFLHGLASSVPSVGHHVAGLYISFNGSNFTMTMEDCYVLHNIGRSVLIEIQQSIRTLVSIINTEIMHGKALKTAGFSYYILAVPNAEDNYLRVVRFTSNTLVINKSHFAHNEAKQSASGVYIAIHDSRCSTNYISISNSNFTRNSIRNNSIEHSTGAALQLMRHPLPTVPNEFSSEKHTFIGTQYTTIFENNNFVQNEDMSTKGAVVEFYHSNNVEFSNCKFLNNTGTALSLHSSNVVFSNHVIFHWNYAMYGAAIQFCEASFFYIRLHTKLEFRNNWVTQKGGAVFVKRACLDKHDTCFFQPVVTGPINIDNFQSETNMSIEFENNTSVTGGDDLYGGNIDNCYTYGTFYNSILHPIHHLSGDVFNALTNMPRSGKSLGISSDPYFAAFCNSSSTDYVIESWPGNTIQVCLQPIGQRDSPTSGSIEVVFNTSQVFVVVQRLYSKYSNRIINITIQSNNTNFTTALTFQLQSYTLFEDGNVTTLYVNIKDCPWGFSLNKTTHECELLPVFKSPTCSATSEYGIKCSRHWIGCANDTCASNTDVIVLHCFDYCQESIVSSSNFDDQCVPGRMGVGCGQCITNHSAVLGTSKCKPCTNSYLWLIVVYLASGVLLVAILSTFDITVTNGTLNGIIFYANVIHTNRVVFFPKEFSNRDILRIALSWMNLDLGLEVCFYEGMTIYQKTWIQFGYILYLWLLQVVIIFLCRRYVFFTRMCGKNVTKVLATIILLSYMKALQVIATSFKNIHMYSRISHQVVWKSNPSISLGSLKLTTLMIAAALLGLILVSFAICLISIQILKKVSHKKGLTWVSRFQPFFEAFTGPCNNHYAFWPGFLFIARFALVTTQFLQDYQFSRYEKGMTCCSVAVMVVVFSFLFPNGIYKKWSLNILELSIFVNLTLISAIVSFKHQRHHEDSIPLLTYVSMIVVLISFLGYKIKNIYKFIRKSGQLIYKKVAHCLCKIIHSSKVTEQLQSCSRGTVGVTHSEIHVSVPPNESSQLLNVSSSQHAKKFKDVREALLEHN